MARRAIYSSELKEETMNGYTSYRVAFGYGAFTISPQKLPNGAVYFYALKRARGRLYKSYVGKRGAIGIDDVHRATMEVVQAIRHDTGGYGRDNAGYGRH